MTDFKALLAIVENQTKIFFLNVRNKKPMFAICKGNRQGQLSLAENFFLVFTYFQVSITFVLRHLDIPSFGNLAKPNQLLDKPTVQDFPCFFFK